MHRRRYLEFVGLSASLGLAGCQDDDSTETRRAETRSNSTARREPREPSSTATTTYTGEVFSTAFIGNSYTASNGLPGVYRSVLRDTETYETRPLRTEAVTPGGEQLHEHVDDLEGGGDVASLLGDDATWDTVVIQEQSQIPGLGESHPEYERSVSSAVTLADAAAATGAGIVLFMTWGRRTGDDYNPQLYDDFETMQERLAEGYRGMADRIEAAGHPVAVAPVGLAFRAVYDTVSVSGTDPATEGTAFWDLYIDDGSHPSSQGTYLAALVIAGTTAGIDPSEIAYRPGSIDGDRATLLRAAATRALRSV